MIKNKLKTLDKRIQQLSKSKMTGVFFVDLLNNEYIVRASGDGKVIFQGERESFEALMEKYSESVFIVDDISKPEDESLYDWAK